MRFSRLENFINLLHKMYLTNSNSIAIMEEVKEETYKRKGLEL